MTWRTLKLSAAVVSVFLSLMACSSPPSQGSAQPSSQSQAAQPQEKQYDLKGKVVGVDKTGKNVSVAGEDIPGFMSAMTMSYPVKNEKLLENLSPGDQITAKVVVNGTEYWLENIAVAGRQ